MIQKEKEYLWDGGSRYGSHIEPLLFIFNNLPKIEKGIELGMGIYSTPLLLERIDKLTSIEMQESEWFNSMYDKLKPTNPDWLPLCLIGPHGYLDFNGDGVSFVLSDGHSNSRPQSVNHFMQKGVETIVGHDTESSWYGWHLVEAVKYGYFEYQFTETAPYTTVWTKNAQLMGALNSRDGKGKVLILNQPKGLGDLIFCQTLAHSFKHLGYKVVFDTAPEYVDGLNRAYPEITFMSNICAPARKEIYEKDGVLIYPLRFSDILCGVPYKDCMKSKYWLYDRVWQNWKRNAMWKRDTRKEADLYYSELGLIDGDKYSLVNLFYKGTNTIKITEPDGKIVQMQNVPGYSIFDWAKVIENASEIHTVSTSIIYLLELLDIGEIPVHIYKREPDEKDHSYYDYLLTKPNYILK